MAAQKMVRWPKIYLFGDSMTQCSLSSIAGWASFVGDHFQRRCDIVLRGFAGYNTRYCRIILPKILDKAEADEIVAMTIFLGANDAAFKGDDEGQHVPLEEYKSNLKTIVEYCESVGIKREKIILITPPVLNAHLWGEFCKMSGKAPSRDCDTSASYSKACLDMAKELGVIPLDLYGEMKKKEDYNPLLYLDGLHLGGEGAKFLFDLLLPILEKLTSHLPKSIFPDWKEINFDNPEITFKEW